jgi:Fur family transcriptional regulator, ferric uptake regulator
LTGAGFRIILIANDLHLQELRVVAGRSTENDRVLQTAGLRNTKQRAAILDIVRTTQGHLDADEVYRKARQRHAGLNLSTVYRTLRMLKEQGFIEEHHLDENHHHYEASTTEEHHHLLCAGCGKVVEFKFSLADFVRHHVKEAKGFTIEKTELSIAGTCPACREKLEKNEKA